MSAGRLPYEDLGAVVYLDDVPAALLAELTPLYASPFSTHEYFRIYDRPRSLCACELREPRHIVVFTVKGATAEMLNKGWSIEPPALERAVEAIFRALPSLRRIRAELDFAPDELTLPVRDLYAERNFVVELPATAQEWESGLGKSTRHHLNRYRNRLRREHPDFELRTSEGEAIDAEIVRLCFAWNRASILAHGERWFYEDEPEASRRFWQLTQQGGMCLRGELDRTCAAVNLSIIVGDQCWALVTGTDPHYRGDHLGFLMLTHLVAAGIERGCRRLHFLWGMSEYKQHLGGRPAPVHRASVFRSRRDRDLYAGERLSVRVWEGYDLRYLSRPRRRPGEPRTAVAPFVAARLKGRRRASREGTEAP
jgi:hypothetical protein